MPIMMHGQWRLRVVESIHNWPNRFVISGASAGDGTYPPNIGSVVVANGLPRWELRAEYSNPATPGAWAASDMSRLSRVQSGAELTYLIGAEDPLPNRDFKDIQWEAIFTGKMIAIPYRPFAVRTSDLFQMPDGIFETALGRYYMGVRVTNTWGEALTATDVLAITMHGRADLAAGGISVIDAWTQQELAMFGQHQFGTGIVIGPLEPGASRTVYFKLDVAAASPRKHMVEFACLNMAGTPDPLNAKRRVSKAIFVSRSYIDSTTKEIVSEVRQGTLRMKLKQVAFDQEGAYRGRKRKPKATPPDDAPSLDELRGILDALLGGKRVDPCRIQRILTCYCQCKDDGGTRDPNGPPSDGRFTYDPFLVLPTKFSFSVTPRVPYAGQYGPIPFDDPWWKCLLLIIAIVLLIAGMLEEGADAAYHDNEFVIGTLDSWAKDNVDGALCKLDTDRVQNFLQVLDAQSNEDNQLPATALDGMVALNNAPLTQAEVQALLALPVADPARKAFKSGARTGLTHAIITGFTTVGHDKVSWDTSVASLINFGPDPAFGNQDVSDKGDSGSVWFQSATMRPVALNHSGNLPGDPDVATGTLMADVARLMGISF